MTKDEVIAVLRGLQDWLYFSSMNGGTKIQREVIDVAIEAIRSEPHWIPVTERLPESKEEDLEYPTVIIDLDGQVALGCYYESTREWGMGEYFNQKCFPIAWMPLPEPYKGVTDGDD